MTLDARPGSLRPADRCRAGSLRRRASHGPELFTGRGLGYTVSPLQCRRASLARATALGISPGQIVEWFLHRTGVPPSPAIRLLFKSTASVSTALKARRMLVLFTPTAELADGLLQHPATRDFLGDRLGPMAVAVPEDLLEKLQGVLKELGLLVVPS